MDKRMEANLRVKNSITEALFTLMNEKNFSEITVTDIVRQAKVARSSYYRNYVSKEDILISLASDVFTDFRNTADYELTDFFTYNNVLRFFTYFKKYQKYILDLYHSKFSASLLEGLNQFLEENAGIMPVHSIEKYNLYIFIGALYNTGIVWLKNGTPESIEDMSDSFCNFIGITIPKVR
jgi:AcrR family transcriptional regulator